MFPHSPFGFLPSSSFLCLRRGVSAIPVIIIACTGLFSAYAEVFPIEKTLVESDLAFLCLRRGVSKSPSGQRLPLCFSLPTQRCFRLYRYNSSGPPLFSAYAEVFLSEAAPSGEGAPFLCLRRGVSKALHTAAPSADFSLPTQRCFPEKAQLS